MVGHCAPPGRGRGPRGGWVGEVGAGSPRLQRLLEGSPSYLASEMAMVVYQTATSTHRPPGLHGTAHYSGVVYIREPRGFGADAAGGRKLGSESFPQGLGAAGMTGGAHVWAIIAPSGVNHCWLCYIAEPVL